MSQEDEKYEALEKIGHGSFGVIRKVKRKSDGYIMCRKEISYLKMSQKEREQLQAELSILKELRHPNIVAYYEREHIKASADLHIYMEYCDNGDLGNHILKLKSKNQLASEDFVWSIFTQLVTALYRCHNGESPPIASTNLTGFADDARPKLRSKQQVMILHRDLKPENVFLGEDNSVKLGDFGLSKIMCSNEFASTYVGTPFYMSPELCSSERYTHYTDIWGLGCIIYELCAKEPPFNARTHMDLVHKIKAGKFAPIPSSYSPELHNVVNSCLRVNPNLRPDTSQLLSLSVVKQTRKYQEVKRLGRQATLEKEQALKALEEMRARLSATERRFVTAHDEIDASLRREWEVKARLEIDRQVGLEMEKLKKTFEMEVSRRVELEVQRRIAERTISESRPQTQQSKRSSWGSAHAHPHTSHSQSSNSQKSNSQKSSTPPRPRSAASNLNSQSVVPGLSQGTAASADGDFPSQTDLSSLSDESTTSSQSHKRRTQCRSSNEEEKPPRKQGRTPFTRAQTYTAPTEAATMLSPIDTEMADPSPISIASLALSPRRTEASKVLQAPDAPKPRGNIFAAAAAHLLEPRAVVPEIEDIDSPTGDRKFAEEDGESEVEDIPTPSRPRHNNTNIVRTHLTSALPPPTAITGDPFKPTRAPRPNMVRQQTMPVPQRAAPPVPTVFDPSSKAAATRQTVTVPIIATSPSRGGGKPSTTTTTCGANEHGSPVRRAAAAATGPQLQRSPSKNAKDKKDPEDLVKRVHRNNLQGRTLVDLAAARVPGQINGGGGPVGGGPVKGKEDLVEEKPSLTPAVWDPENEEMPSPFLVRGKNVNTRVAWR
ncbi:MAG: G2-specific serine/threonine protein kinase [Bogoriella megaspora]|nr:MAG: G2-specific serine/threonine protein kinase [Bogoriella megaspora]